MFTIKHKTIEFINVLGLGGKMPKYLFLLSLLTKCNILDHVEDLLCPVEPDIVVRYGHCLEGDLLGILEVRVWAPDSVEPFYRQQLILSASKENILTAFLCFKAYFAAI